MLKRLLASFFALLFSLFQGAPAETRCDPAPRGSFIQAWYCADWDEARWDEETAFLKEAGAEYLILQSAAAMDADGRYTVYYPSSLPAFENAAFGGDALGGALKSCKKAGLRLFVGLADAGDWWSAGGFSRGYKTACALSAEMLREIHGAYAAEYGDTLCGWYFAPEIDNIPQMKLSVRRIVKGLNAVLDAATETDPAIPLLLSPFYTEKYALPSVLATLPMWQTILNAARFRDGDILCPQDAVGAGWTREKSLDKMWKMYAAAVASAPVKLRLWANCENFAAGEDGNVPAPVERFARQTETAARYAEKIVCFSLDHYYSPFVDAAAYEAYRARFAQ